MEVEAKDWIELVKSVGYPIVVSTWLMWRLEKLLMRLLVVTERLASKLGCESDQKKE